MRQAFGCTAVWKRLRPDAYCSAEALARAEASAMDTRMAQARREFTLRERVDSLTAHHVPRICARFDAISLATDAEERAAMAHADRAAHRSLMTDAHAQARDELAYLDTSTIEETAAELLELEGLSMPSDHRVWDQVLLALLRQNAETNRKLAALAHGEPLEVPIVPPPAKEPVRLGHLVEGWARQQHVVEKSIWSTLNAVSRFESICGELAVDEITSAHARQFRDHLLQVENLAAKTTRTYLGFLKTLVQYSMSEDIARLTRNPFVGVTVGRICDKSRRKIRRSFTSAELDRLFRSRVFTAGYRPRAAVGEAAYWLPLLGLFTGARLEELAQLQVGDVRATDGRWFIAIHAHDGEHHLKNEASWRLVPLHREVLAAGFLEYVAALSASGVTRLFPALKPDRFGKRSFGFSKWFGRYMDRCGLPDSSLDFHCFRATFKDLCRLAGVPEDVHDALTGHVGEGRQTARSYGNRQYPEPPLFDAIKAIAVPDLDLGHLAVSGNLDEQPGVRCIEVRATGTGWPPHKAAPEKMDAGPHEPASRTATRPTAIRPPRTTQHCRLEAGRSGH